MKNEIRTIQTDYLRPNISVEIMEVSNKINNTVVYLHNWKGLRYDVCASLKEVSNCIDGGIAGPHFDDEEKAIEYIENLKF